jgi:hypothetical protein
VQCVSEQTTNSLSAQNVQVVRGRESGRVCSLVSYHSACLPTPTSNQPGRQSPGNAPGNIARVRTTGVIDAHAPGPRRRLRTGGLSSGETRPLVPGPVPGAGVCRVCLPTRAKPSPTNMAGTFISVQPQISQRAETKDSNPRNQNPTTPPPLGKKPGRLGRARGVSRLNSMARRHGTGR